MEGKKDTGKKQNYQYKLFICELRQEEVGPGLLTLAGVVNDLLADSSGHGLPFHQNVAVEAGEGGKD